jgi:hypothetical protein
MIKQCIIKALQAPRMKDIKRVELWKNWHRLCVICCSEVTVHSENLLKSENLLNLGFNLWSLYFLVNSRIDLRSKIDWLPVMDSYPCGLFEQDMRACL